MRNESHTSDAKELSSPAPTLSKGLTMRIRTLAASAVLAAALGLPLAGVAFAQENKNCPDFATQAEAQAALEPGDPDNLDRDGDGQACEDSEYASVSAAGGDDSTSDSSSEEQVADKPVGGVEAGDGPASGTDPLPLVAGAVIAGGVGAVAVRRVARRTS